MKRKNLHVFIFKDRSLYVAYDINDIRNLLPRASVHTITAPYGLIREAFDPQYWRMIPDTCAIRFDYPIGNPEVRTAQEWCRRGRGCLYYASYKNVVMSFP